MNWYTCMLSTWATDWDKFFSIARQYTCIPAYSIGLEVNSMRRKGSRSRLSLDLSFLSSMAGWKIVSAHWCSGLCDWSSAAYHLLCSARIGKTPHSDDQLSSLVVVTRQELATFESVSRSNFFEVLAGCSVDFDVSVTEVVSVAAQGKVSLFPGLESNQSLSVSTSLFAEAQQHTASDRKNKRKT